ncbi:MAG: glucosaminidase domain-containing protein [Chloroflexales bacterium]
MSSADNRRTNQPRQQRPRREPLFPLEAEDIAPRIRRGPPAPLGDLFDDLNAAMPTKADGERHEVAHAQPAASASPVPPRRTAPAPPAPQARSAAASGRQARSTAQVKTQVRPQPRSMVLGHPDDDLVAAQKRYDDTEAAMHQAMLLAAHPYHSDNPLYTLPPINLSRGLMLGIVAVASLLIVIGTIGSSSTSVSRWGGDLLRTMRAENMTDASQLQLVGTAHPAGDYTLKAGPSLSAQQIDAILASYGSPAAGTGAAWYTLGEKYGIDPAFAVAFFIHESSAGTNAEWAGLKPDGASTHNVGNIICAGYASCYGRFRDYSSWNEGIDDWYHLIDSEYIQGRGVQTVQDIVPIYAPSFENDVQSYISSVTGMVDEWRTNGVH